jgi:hypothetical protein
MKWLFLTPISLLVPATILLQVEIHNVALEVAKARWQSGNAALAVEKFEQLQRASFLALANATVRA